ncbi:MAG: hypothetical protein IJ244_06715 [Bacteroidaceae bacterium]|nr:hypothetical protein [Bacteroidaceae bacterium]
MKSIESINFSELHSPQVMQFIMDALTAAQADEKVSVKLETEISTMQKANEELDVQIKLVKTSDLTVEIKETKKQLGKIYSAMYNIVKSMNISAPSDAMSKSAYKLMLLLKSYGIRPSMEKMDLLNFIHNLTEDLSSDEYVSDVKALNLDLWVKALMHQHDELEKVTKKRTAAKPQRGTYHIWESRQKAITAYREFAAQVNALARVEKTTDYDAFIDAQNQRVMFYKQSVIASNKRADGKADSTTDTSDTTPGNAAEPTVQDDQQVETPDTTAGQTEEAAVQG